MPISTDNTTAANFRNICRNILHKTKNRSIAHKLIVDKLCEAIEEGSPPYSTYLDVITLISKCAKRDEDKRVTHLLSEVIRDS